MDQSEIKLLLDYVEANCILTTAQGLNLKKSEFDKAHVMVKSKDVNQCCYKWGHVISFLSMKVFIADPPF
jgi:sRNA-binding regulator protein Hfq